jgi:ATPases involved in chromosome partitioning
MSKCKIITVANQKGGVSKTTSVRNLAYSLAELGYRTLTADADPQSNLTASLAVENESKDTPKICITMANLMTMAMDGEELPPKSEYIYQRGRIDFIPNDIHLSVVEANLRMEMGSEKLLSSILEPLREDYDYILVDTLCA